MAKKKENSKQSENCISSSLQAIAVTLKLNILYKDREISVESTVFLLLKGESHGSYDSNKLHPEHYGLLLMSTVPGI